MDDSGLEALGALEEKALLVPTPEPARSSLRDRITALPDRTIELWHGAGDVFRVGWTEWRESDHKLRTIAVSTGALVLQAAERARATTIIVPPIAFDILQTTGSPVEAAGAGGLTFGMWCALVGAVTTEAIDHHPKGVIKLAENFPRAVRLAVGIGKTLPGLHPSAPKDEDASHLNRLGGRLGTGLKRGYAMAGVGNTAYVAAAAAEGMTRREVHKLSLNASADTGAAIGIALFGVSEAIVHVAHKHPALAEQIQHDASNKKYLSALAGMLIVRQIVTNKIKSVRGAKHQEQSEETPN